MEILKRIWQGWKRFGEMLGDVVARVVLTIFYFTIFLPFGLVSRWRRDPLAIRNIENVEWTSRPPLEATLEKNRKLG